MSIRQLRPPRIHYRPLSTLPSTSSKPPSQPKTYSYSKPPPKPDSWLASYLKRTPIAMSVFNSVTGVMGMGNPRQVAGRVTYHYYERGCATRVDVDRNFWHEDCKLPPTFQTWFTVTNLHVWLLTVRFRALPEPYGRHFVQGLIDNFFLDIEDRLRRSLPARAPERLVTRQMKILREQWAGLGLSFDYALGLSSPYSLRPTQSQSIALDALTTPQQPNGDAEMAAAVWRNLLGARGASGISDPGPNRIRHSVNVSGEYAAPKLDKSKPEDSLRALEETEDGSGVYDFIGEETKRYVDYPVLMYKLVRYVRTELSRLEKIEDKDIIDGKGVGEFAKLSRD